MRLFIAWAAASWMMTALAHPALANGEGGGESGGGALIVTMGVITLTLLIITFLLGLFMPKDRKKLFPWHKRLAWVTAASGIIHASLVLFLH